jgi:predicted DNA-binding transcriptional regulator AlpA
VSDRLDLAVLMAEPSRALTMSATDIATALDEATRQRAQLDTLTSILAARLAATSPDSAASKGDRWLTAAQVAARTTFSVDYLYRHADKLPFTVRQGRSVRFSEARLDLYMKQKTR